MRKAKQSAKKKPGRKPKGGRSYTVKLTDEVAAKLRKLGEDNLTLGIERAAGSAGGSPDV